MGMAVSTPVTPSRLMTNNDRSADSDLRAACQAGSHPVANLASTDQPVMNQWLMLICMPGCGGGGVTTTGAVNPAGCNAMARFHTSSPFALPAANAASSPSGTFLSLIMT